MGLEPTISGTTIRRANQLHHTHHTEPGGIRTLDLRLRRPLLYPAELQTHFSLNENLSFSNEKRVMGIEPTYPAWKAGVLPLNYTRSYEIVNLHPSMRAIDGARTRGLDLGKVARYQLRHYRISG